MTSPRALITSLAVAALALVGCSTSGGDDEVSGTTTVVATTVDSTDPETTTTEPDATTTTEAEGPTTTSGSDDDLCVPLRKISDYDKEAGATVRSGDWPTIQRFFIDTTDEVVDIYDEAIALDTDLSDELEKLKAVSESTADFAAESSSIVELSDKLTSQPGITEAGRAGLAVNAYAESTCGFSTGGN